jgi:hypothetical protein
MSHPKPSLIDAPTVFAPVALPASARSGSPRPAAPATVARWEDSQTQFAPIPTPEARDRFLQEDSVSQLAPVLEGGDEPEKMTAATVSTAVRRRVVIVAASAAAALVLAVAMLGLGGDGSGAADVAVVADPVQRQQEQDHDQDQDPVRLHDDGVRPSRQDERAADMGPAAAPMDAKLLREAIEAIDRADHVAALGRFRALAASAPADPAPAFVAQLLASRVAPATPGSRRAGEGTR